MFRVMFIRPDSSAVEFFSGWHTGGSSKGLGIRYKLAWFSTKGLRQSTNRSRMRQLATSFDTSDGRLADAGALRQLGLREEACFACSPEPLADRTARPGHVNTIPDRVCNNTITIEQNR